MRIVNFEIRGVPAIAADEGSGWHGLTQPDSGFPGTLPELIAHGADLLHVGRTLGQSPEIDLKAVRLLPPVPAPPKILCVGLNYDDHLQESGLKKPAYPEIFARFATSLIAHQEAIRRPRESVALDYEAELAVVIGKPGRRIPQEQALDHVAGYSLFNDATVRDFQLRTSQWTMGKNFRWHRIVRPVAGDARCRAAGCPWIAHPGPFEWPRDAGCANRPAHLRCPSAD
jgi:acylpyruvate hydrolase